MSLYTMKFETTYLSDDPSLMAQLAEVKKYQPFILEACKKYNFFQPSVIGGLGSRESHWGLTLTPPGPAGTGDFHERKFATKYRSESLPPDGGGFGRGLMQIDYDWHEFARSDWWPDPRENILYGCQLLAQYWSEVGRDISYHPLAEGQQSLTPEQTLRATLASYNAGPPRVLRAIRARGVNGVDEVTSGRNFSANVLNRAGWFQLHGWA